MRKTVYIGTNDHCAEIILHNEEFELEAVICEESRLSNEMLTFCLVRNVRLVTVENKEQLVSEIKCFSKDTIFVMYSFALRVPMELLEGYSIFNIHPSDLPDYRGAHPTYWATIKNEKKIGVSIFKITDKLDLGYYVSKKFVDYYYWEDEAILEKKVEETLPFLLEDLKEYLYTGCESEITGEGKYYPKVGRKDVFIDLNNDTPDLIFNKVRAEKIFGGAKIILEGKTYCIAKFVFEKKRMEEPYCISEKALFIKYTDDLIISVSEYSVLNEDFKFRGEK